MVFFTCNACGESLKKGQVDKHVMKCRGCQVLSCIDCGKDFWGEDYNNHVKCISEDQKYGGKGYEAKANKGDVKQQQWLQRINEAMSKPGVSAKLRDVLHQVSAYENVPRKKAKFQNWMRNSLKIANPGLQEEVWNIIATADSAPLTTQPTKESAVCVDTNGIENHADQSNTEGRKKLNKRERKEARQQKNGKASKRNDKRTAEEEPEKLKKNKKDRKRKHEEDDEQTEDGVDKEDVKKTKFDEAADDLMSEETEDQAVSQGKFNWKGNIKAVLRESSDQELSLKKLRKKVLAAYYSFTGGSNFKTEEEVLALFNKKITKNPKFRVLKDKVKLVQ